eukprot:scaffold2163_cov158-Ochromonas_danica.AAC.9
MTFCFSHVTCLDGYDQVDPNLPATSFKNQVAGFLQAVRYLKVYSVLLFSLPSVSVISDISPVSCDEYL